MTKLEIVLSVISISLLGTVFVLIWACAKLNRYIERLESQLPVIEETEWWHIAFGGTD